jgi:pantetheine-phosphate adenylyltransferase
MFDRVIVAVYDRPNKPLAFTASQRAQLFERGMTDVPQVEVATYTGLTIDFARDHGAGFLIRGLRATSDFEYEYQMTTMNRHLAPGIDTIFLMTTIKYAYLSSSLIKEVAAQGAPLDGLVPEFVAEALVSLYGRSG